MAKFDGMPGLEAVARHRARLGGPTSLAYVRASAALEKRIRTRRRQRVPERRAA